MKPHDLTRIMIWASHSTEQEIKRFVEEYETYKNYFMRPNDQLDRKVFDIIIDHLKP